MKNRLRYVITSSVLVLSSYSAFSADIDKEPKAPVPVQTSADQPAVNTDAKTPAPEAAMDAAAVEKILATWPERPVLGARQMIEKYGEPQEATADILKWHNPGPYKCISITKVEDPHDFPLPHTDFLEHTVEYKVPASKADELAKFDGSLTFNKTRGTMSARCDSECHNILTLNLANDIIMGKRTAEEARKAFGEYVAEDMTDKKPAYTTALQFEPAKMTKDCDKTTIPGSPKRAMKEDGEETKIAKKESKTSADAEILSLIIAVDKNEIGAATEAEKRKLSPAIIEFATTMHTEHGVNAVEAMKLGHTIELSPLDTEKTNECLVKGAGELATLMGTSENRDKVCLSGLKANFFEKTSDIFGM